MSVPARQIRTRDPSQVELAPIDQDPRHQKVRGELAALEKRYTESEKRRKVALARGRGQQPTRTLAERAADLLKGGKIVTLPPASEQEAAAEEMDILARAIVTKREELAAVRSEISAETCRRFKAPMEENLRAALDAATHLHTALEAARIIRGRLLGAGYELNESVLPVHHFPAAATLGDPERHSLTPAGMFRDWLSERGVI